MTPFSAIVALVLLAIGTVFLVAAAVGVLRFPDALQRMHAATKAGTVGAVFMLLGAMTAQGRGDSTVIGLVAIAFLLLTVPIAAHLLGRAIYVSGAAMVGLADRDALSGRLPRHVAPLERRTGSEADASALLPPSKDDAGG